MNTQNSLKNTGNLGKFLYRNRGYTPYPIVLFFIFFATPTTNTFFGGIIVMLLGEVGRLWSVAYAGKETRSFHIYAEKLITAGPYAWVRNPIYIANLGLYSGVTIIANFYLIYFLPAIWFYFGVQYYFIVKTEEQVLLDLFGHHYLTYKRLVPRWFPKYPRQQLRRSEPNYKNALTSEKSTLIGFFLMIVVLFLHLQRVQS